MTKIKKPFIARQQDQTDCGIACIYSIVKHFGGNEPLEKLRELSGTNISGTTMLGLFQCAEQIGLKATGYVADLDDLKGITDPVILNVLIDKRLQHYVLLYPKSETANNIANFIIGDPATGKLKNISRDELNELWQSKGLLTLVPTEKFLPSTKQNILKWNWFLKIIKPDKSILILAAVLGLIITVMNLATAIFSQKLVDVILPTNDKFYLLFNVVGLFFILTSKTALNYLRQNLSLIQSRNFSNRIVSNFFNNLVYLPKSFFDKRKTGDMITRMNDTSRIQKNLNYVLGSVLIDVLILFTTATFLIQYSITISCITFLFIPIIIFIVLKFSTPIKLHQRDVMVSSSSNESNYIDIIQGITVIKTFNREENFTTNINTIFSKLQDKITSLGQISNRFSLVMDLVGIILSITLTTVASFLVMNKQLKIGEMMAIISLAGTLIPAVARLSQINLQLQEAKVAFDRMYDFTSVKPEYEKQEISSFLFEKLAVKNISFRFAGRKTILQDISFEVAKGEMIAVLGESGCGKSTTMAILEKFYQPENGVININGTSLANIYTPTWRNIVATVPQDIKLFNGTLLDNISIGNTIEEATSIIDFCNKVGLNKFFEVLPQRYFTLVGEDGINLSGGQKQLLAIARALYRKPQVLLLDEATAAMDRNTERFILQLLKSIQNEMAIVLITHKVQTAKIADRVYIIEEGKIAASGKPTELLETDNFFSQLVVDATV